MLTIVSSLMLTLARVAYQTFYNPYLHDIIREQGKGYGSIFDPGRDKSEPVRFGSLRGELDEPTSLAVQ